MSKVVLELIICWSFDLFFGFTKNSKSLYRIDVSSLISNAQYLILLSIVSIELPLLGRCCENLIWNYCTENGVNDFCIELKKYLLVRLTYAM